MDLIVRQKPTQLKWFESNRFTESWHSIRKQSNSFRGPLGNGVSTHKNIPVSWDGAKGKKSNMESKDSKSRVTTLPSSGVTRYLLPEPMPKSESQCSVMICSTGKLLWQKDAGKIPGSPAAKPEVSQDTGLISFYSCG